MYVYLKYFAFILQQLGQFKGQEVDIIVEDIIQLSIYNLIGLMKWKRFHYINMCCSAFHISLDFE